MPRTFCPAPLHMHIALCQETIDTQRGGAETSTLEMARGLAALGHAVTLVACGTPADAARLRSEHNLAAELIPPARGRLSRTRRFLAHQARVCRPGAFDIVHAVSACTSADVYQPRGGTYGETIRRSVALGRTPLTRALRALLRRGNLRQQLLLRTERALLDAAAPPHVAAVSGYVARQVQMDFPRLPPERLHVIFNGVDFTPLPPEEQAAMRGRWRARLGAGDDRPVVLFVAHNFRLKGLGDLLRASATARAQAADWLLVIAGRDREEPYRPLVERLALAPRVRFVGAGAPMPQLYAAADVLAHPTWYDPCSRVVLEARCAGLPVVTTRWNGAAEVLTDGADGVILDDPHDPAALAAALSTCLTPACRAAAQQAAPAARHTLAMSRHVRELADLYERIMAARNLAE